MKQLNILFSLNSLIVLLVTIERFSPTTKIFLQPYNFFRLHEVLQMSTLILFSVIISCLILYFVSIKLYMLKTQQGKLIAILFLVGIYFYATGNGVHETASFFFNTFCGQSNAATSACKSMFFNDYYFGNILYFIGAFLMTIPLLAVERRYPNMHFTRNDYIILYINCVFYAFAIIAYAAFDKALVGFWYVLITTIFADAYLLLRKTKYTELPVTVYTAATYTAGTVVSLILRFH